MSLYLVVFDGADEIAGCLVGHYSDFACFRDTIESKLGGSQFPTLMLHSDCDGQWDVTDLASLKEELNTISTHFKNLPPMQLDEAFEHTRPHRAQATCLYECFHDVAGDNLFDSLLELCNAALKKNCPILFQ